MRAKYLLIVLVVMLLMVIGYNAMAVPETTRTEDKKPEVISTGLDDQIGMALTIYNVNLGLVKDQREISLTKGTGELRFMDVASQIIPTSVHKSQLPCSLCKTYLPLVFQREQGS